MTLTLEPEQQRQEREFLERRLQAEIERLEKRIAQLRRELERVETVP